MIASPQIEVIGERIVRFDQCQVGHISREGRLRRFWFWPEYDMRAARPVTGDLSPCLHDGARLRKAIASALSRTASDGLQRSPRKSRSRFNLPRWPFLAYIERLARIRDQRVFANARIAANRR